MHLGELFWRAGECVCVCVRACEGRCPNVYLSSRVLNRRWKTMAHCSIYVGRPAIYLLGVVETNTRTHRENAHRECPIYTRVQAGRQCVCVCVRVKSGWSKRGAGFCSGENVIWQPNSCIVCLCGIYSLRFPPQTRGVVRPTNAHTHMLDVRQSSR